MPRRRSSVSNEKTSAAASELASHTSAHEKLDFLMVCAPARHFYRRATQLSAPFRRHATYTGARRLPPGKSDVSRRVAKRAGHLGLANHDACNSCPRPGILPVSKPDTRRPTNIYRPTPDHLSPVPSAERHSRFPPGTTSSSLSTRMPLPLALPTQ